MSTRLRQFGPIVVVLVLTAVGFFVSRAHGESDARHDSFHRAEIAATQVRDRVAQAATLLDGVRRLLAGPDSDGVTTEQFGDVGARWLGPVGLPAAAWVERVPAAERSAYEARTGHHVVVPTAAGGLTRAPARAIYFPATLVTNSPPMSAPGIDAGGFRGIAAATARPRTAYRVSATGLGRIADGTSGLFLVQSAQRLNRGVVQPGFVVVFLPASWLVAGAADTAGANPSVQITVGGGSAGDLVRGAATARSTFTAAGQRFDVRVPFSGIQGAAAAQPWMIGGAGLMLAALAGALGLIAARRAKAKAEVDRLFDLSPDLIVVSGFDGYFKRVNPSFERNLGYTQQEALARPYVEFVHPDDRDATESRRVRLTEGETNVAFENRYLCKDGSVRWIEWTATPVAKERVTYAVGRDITERRQAESDLRNAEERNRALAEEQAGLRRVATLVAHGVPPEQLFAAVTEEVGNLLPVGSSAMGRYEVDGTFTTVAAWSAGKVAFPVGRRWVPEGRNITAMVFETGRPARMDDFTDASGPIGEAARDAGYRSAVGTPIVVEGRLWGLISAASTADEPLRSDTEARLASFTELVATAVANAQSRSELAQLAEQQAALRRVATLVAEAVPPAEVCSALCDEVTLLVDADVSVIGRLETSGRVTVLAVSGPSSEASLLGTEFDPEHNTVVAAVIRAGRAARKDDYSDASGPAQRLGIRSGVGVPIVVEGAMWGVVAIGTARERFPKDTEQRLEQFTRLAATAIANAENRAGLAQLADEQAALRRVATLVAQGVPSADLFSAVTEEVRRLIGAEMAAIMRFDHDDPAIVFAGVTTNLEERVPVGTRWALDDLMATTKVYRTGRSARVEGVDWSSVTGPIGDAAQQMDVVSTCASPIEVEGRLWGTMSVSNNGPLPLGTEERLEKFTGHVATAIANAASRDELAASRARVVAASDETRRRIERDLHDGTQQHLVSLSLQLRLAESSVPAELEQARATIDAVAGELNHVIDELREISRGIHPAILSEGGLGPALRTLARRSTIPVELGDVIDHRLSEPIEVAAYYVVSEALTNAVKHASASRVVVEAAVRDGNLELSISDDGVGGADPAGGSGLIGLRDRVEALGGSIEIDSPEGRGTRVIVELPVEPNRPAPPERPRLRTTHAPAP